MISVPVRSADAAAQNLTQRVALFLSQLRLTPHSRLVVEARGGVLTLTGVVPTYHQRQRIVAAARQVAGVIHVVDQMEVEESEAAMV
jgi:osmotically-inducible protein OsmY